MKRKRKKRSANRVVERSSPEVESKRVSASGSSVLPARITKDTGEKHAVLSEPETPVQANLLKQILDRDQDEDEGTKLLPVQEEEFHTLLFQLCGESYALDIGEVEQIVRYTEPTSVPHTVESLEGIIAFRGKMVPVIHGRKRMGREVRSPDRKSRIIIVRDNVEYIGILVDSVSQVIRIPKSSVQPTPSVIPGNIAEFMDGVAGYQGKMVILLNTRRFLQFK